MSITCYKPSENPFLKTIEVCGCRTCLKCAGTGIRDFPTDEPLPCITCKGTRKKAYFETKPNPYYGKTKDVSYKIIDTYNKKINTYKYKKQCEKICTYLMNKNNLKPDTIESYKGTIKIYEGLCGDNPIIRIAKLQIKRLEKTNNEKNRKTQNESENKTNSSGSELSKPYPVLNFKNASTTLEKSSKIAFDKKNSSSQNILKDIEESCMKKAILNPVPERTFKTPLPKTFEHIPNLHKPQTPAITIKPVKWNEWCDFESDNGGFVDIMGRHSEMWGRVMLEQEKIIWAKQFVSEYRKYAEHCKSQGLEPDPIPDEDVLRRRLEWVTLSDGTRIYNKHYDPPGCCIM